MLSNIETPRPLPPAKARRASALLKASSSTTPPPAYGSPFSFPSRGMQRKDILGSPMTNTFQMVGWDAADPGDQQLPSPPPESQDPEWVNERSREELEELLVKADGIIKERENELGLASAVCKGLYQNNVDLRSKHQAMVARIPVSPARSNSSPEDMSKMVLSNTSMASSTSDSALGLIKSPRPSFYRRHARKISIATADISLLEDQNAQLLEKLEKLEAEATSADHAGRRELKRLEKEITFLREALEKTQLKSEELEEKVQGAVVGEAWRRKKEREAKFKAMRNLGRDSDAEDSPIRNFAPEGSRYGGPSNTFSFFPSGDNRDAGVQLKVKGPSISTANEDKNLDALSKPEHSLIQQLLVKVQELEQTNVRILEQQSETATQLSAVQRDTANIAKVYECLSEPNAVELALESSEFDEEYRESSSTNTIKFMSLRKNIETETNYDGTCIVRPEFGASAGKNRKSVMGLFDDPVDKTHTLNDTATMEGGQNDDEEESWGDDPEPSTWSSNAISQNLDLTSPPMPGALSPLHFFSPAPRIPPELSPISSQPTLESELNKLGDDWEMQSNNHRIRSLSIYDLSQMSVPTSPSPLSHTATHRLADELDADADEINVLPITPLLSSVNSLRLSIEPPTPHRFDDTSSDYSHAYTSAAAMAMMNGRSPRMQMMSDTLRSRTNRWANRRLQRSRSGDDDVDGHYDYRRDSEASRPPSPLDIGIPERLSYAVDNMIEGFNDFTGVTNANASSLSSSISISISRPTTPTPSSSRRDTSSMLLQQQKDKEETELSPEKKKEDANASSGFLLQFWLWLQFAIVIFVFLYAMARKGPTVMLSDEQKRAVARRR